MKRQLNKIEILNNLSPETMERISGCGKIQEVPKGTILIRAREPVGSVYFQLSGKSIIYNLNHEGKRKILFILGKGKLLNEHILNDATSSVYCETLEKSRIFVVPSTDFMQIMSEDFALTKHVLAAQERKIRRLSHQLKNTTSSIYLEKKLAAKLWKLSRDFGLQTEEGIEIDLNLSVTFLADMLGVPRETTSRACSVLVDHGLIRMNRKRIVILDPAKITRFYRTGETK